MYIVHTVRCPKSSDFKSNLLAIIHPSLEGCKGHTHKGHREKVLKVMNFKVFSGCFHHPAAKGIRQKELGKTMTKNVAETSEKVTELPKTKKVIELLLPTSLCGTLNNYLKSRHFVRSEKLQNESSPTFFDVRPEFGPEFLSEFSEEFACFSFLWEIETRRNSQKSPPFFNAKFPGKFEEEIHRSFLEVDFSTIRIIAIHLWF